MKRRNDGWLRRAVIGTAMVLPLIAGVIWIRSDNRPLPTIVLETPRAIIRVEVADTPRARSAGLSRREAVGDVDGLLLQWEAPGRHPIWMADMRFPLDLIWLDADGRVLAILENVPPCSARPCRLYEPEGTSNSIAVLELPASAARVRRIVVGARVRSLVDARQRPE
jgi:uncharacterized membrane protein (UPF0127 family)